MYYAAKINSRKDQQQERSTAGKINSRKDQQQERSTAGRSDGVDQKWWYGV